MATMFDYVGEYCKETNDRFSTVSDVFGLTEQVSEKEIDQCKVEDLTQIEKMLYAFKVTAMMTKILTGDKTVHQKGGYATIENAEKAAAKIKESGKDFVFAVRPDEYHTRYKVVWIENEDMAKYFELKDLLNKLV